MRPDRRNKQNHRLVRLLIIGLALVGIGLAPSACHKTYVLSPLSVSSPSWTATASPTVTTTPTLACGFVDLASLGTPTPIPTFIVWDTATPNPTLVFTFAPTSTPPPTNTPVVSHDLFTGQVLRTLADWQALYGASSFPPPGVDFNTQMVLINTFPSCCSGSTSITDVCERASEIDLILYRSAGAPCNMVCYRSQSIVIPKSNLPIYITETTYGTYLFYF